MNEQRMLTMLSLAASQMRHDITRSKSCGVDFHLPEIAEEDRIRVNMPKIRKHATKRRINKLHDKIHRKK
jgi:hypothetical protein